VVTKAAQRAFSYLHRHSASNATRRSRKDFKLVTKCNYHHVHSLAVINLNMRDSADTVAASI
jgi:hypothetical protein